MGVTVPEGELEGAGEGVVVGESDGSGGAVME